MPRRTVKSIIADIDATISTYELELSTEDARTVILRAKIEALQSLRDGTRPDITRRAASHTT
jgi:hypothetical protein